MGNAFPRTDVAGVSLSRMIIGTNWLLGYSHTSPSADARIRQAYASPQDFFPMFEAFMQHGVDTIMGPIGAMPLIIGAIEHAKQKLGRDIVIVDTPVINVSDSAQARREAEATIQRGAAAGAKFSLLHHSSVEQLVNKNLGTIERLPDYTQMVRDAGLIPGLSAHMPELVVYSDANGYDVQTYIQIYNCMGFMMQVEIETVSGIIHSAKKPVMTIKPMAAGRVTPYVGLSFAWHTIRPCDMVTVGCFTPDEAHEDVEISLAALEGRFPNLERRSSPNTEQAAFGKGAEG
ncbi:MAG: hypothetical protein LBJ10_10790 [Clostridiales bacterium]|jgi:hypothetical protein|nr:hypothetical protein [Clostridiales bacterium]